MNINGENIDIDDLISQNYMHREIKKGIFLSDYQLSILSNYGININSISSINDLMFQIDEILDVETDCDDLELVSKEISEFNYYANTNK